MQRTLSITFTESKTIVFFLYQNRKEKYVKSLVWACMTLSSSKNTKPFSALFAYLILFEYGSRVRELLHSLTVWHLGSISLAIYIIYVIRIKTSDQLIVLSLDRDRQVVSTFFCSAWQCEKWFGTAWHFCGRSVSSVWLWLCLCR